MNIFTESSDNIFETLFESVSEGIVVVNRAQVIVATNAAANEMFGYKSDELLEQPLKMLIPMKHRKEHDGHLIVLWRIVAKDKWGVDATCLE